MAHLLLHCAPRSMKIVSIDVRYLMQDLGMEVHIVSKEWPFARMTCKVAVDQTATDALKTFCAMYCLSDQDCCLFYQDVAVSEQPLKQIIQAGTAGLQLRAVFQPTAAFYTWYSLKMLRQTTPAQAHKPAAWKTCVNHISTLLVGTSGNQNHGAALSAVVQVQPTALMPVTQSADINNLDLSSGTQHLMRLLHMMRLDAPESPQQDSTRLPDTAALAHHDSSELHGSDVTPDSYAKFFARALLLLKLINLSSGVDSGNPASHEDLLWVLLTDTFAFAKKAYADLPNGLKRMQTCDSPKLETFPMWSDLVRLLAQLQQLISKSAVGTKIVVQLDACWTLQRMLMAFNYQAVAAEIISQGALPVLLAFFEHRQLACDACIMISALLDNEGFTYAHKRNTASLLIQLPAIHCFSTLLEPLDADELPVNLKWCPYLEPDGSSEEIQQLKFLYSVIRVMNLTLMCGGVRRDAALTPAEWLALKPVISRAAAAACLLLSNTMIKQSASHDANNKQTCELLEDCQKGLQILLYQLVVEYLPNPELDQSQVIHEMLLPVLYYWEPAAAPPAVSNQLALALLKRAAEDRAVLVCNDGVSQQVQLHNMDMLWHMLGKMVVNKEHHVAAAALLQALFACCANDGLCKGFLVRQHARCVEYANGTNRTAAGGELRHWKSHTIFMGLEGQLPAQLTFAACLTCLVSEEATHQLQSGRNMDSLAGPGTVRAAWSLIAEDLYKALRAALETRLPWSAEHCLALARALAMFSRMGADPASALPNLTAAINQRQGLLPLLQQRLRSLHKLTPDVRLQQQFLVATLWVLCPEWESDELHMPEGLTQLLVDLMVKYSKPSGSTQSAAPQTVASDIGLCALRPWELQTRVLNAVMKSLCDEKDFQYLGKHAFPLCVPPVVEYAQASMERYEKTGRVTPYLPDLRPYFFMLGTHQLTIGPKQSDSPPPGAAQAMLQLLFLMVHRLATVHHMDQSPKVTQDEKDCAPWCTTQVAMAKNCLLGLMIAIKNLREDEPWMRAWAALRAWSWCKDRSTPDRLMKWLKALVHGNMLTKRDVHKILDYLVVKMDPVVAEAAAAKAAAQLLAEEDQAASKAAAKKAKKLRQKLAKKQQAQSDAAESTSANMLSTEDTVEAEAAAPQSPGQLADQLEALRLPTAPASADDSRNQSEAPTRLHPVANSQPPPLQPHVPSCSQDTTPELHAAPQQSTVLEQPDGVVPMLDQSGGLAVHGSEQAAARPPGLPGLQPDPDARFLHSLFCCPITQSRMTDPVVAADGRTYERAAMEEWLQQHDTSPVTGTQLRHARLVPNVVARGAIVNHLV